MKGSERIHFDIVKCVTSGDGFKKGHYYAQIGYNNGIGICKQTDSGDCEVKIYQTGGCGKGIFNNWDNSGKPSFNPVCFAVDPKVIPDAEYRN